MTGAMSAFEQFDVNCDINAKLPDGRITLIVMKIIAWHLMVLMQNTKKTMMLHSAGVDVKKIHKALVIHTPGENEDEYTKTRDVLNNYFMPKKNVEYEINNFRQEKHCECYSVDREIKSHII